MSRKAKRGFWDKLFGSKKEASPSVQRVPRKVKMEKSRKTMTMPRGSRMYATAVNSRLTAGWGTANSSADSEILSSLQMLRSRSRALVRDAAYAKRAKTIVVNNVVGAGIGMQAQVATTRPDETGFIKLNTRINNDIETTWEKWSCAEYCHTGGKLAFGDIERMAMGQIFEAGEVIIREHFTTFGESKVPYALEIIEPERLAEDYQTGVPPIGSAAYLRMGIEMDAFNRPIAFFIREGHPGDYHFARGVGSERLFRVTADQIFHLFLVERWPQTRGVPWLHACARRLNDMDGYSEAELVAARGAASYMATIETPAEMGIDDPSIGEEQEDGTLELALEPGLVPRLRPGEKLNPYMPNRPNSQIDPFMRLLLREAAAGTNVSYESLSRDYSQSNYSSSRLALMDDRDIWRVLQLWFIRSFRERVHKRWLQQAVFARAVTSISVEAYASDPEKFEAVKFKPRGWSWIDPEKEVNARKEAIKAGLDTLTNVIAETGNGRDIEDVFQERNQELELRKKYPNLESFDTDPVEEVVPQPFGSPAKGDDTDEPTSKKVVNLKGV